MRSWTSPPVRRSLVTISSSIRTFRALAPKARLRLRFRPCGSVTSRQKLSRAPKPLSWKLGQICQASRHRLARLDENFISPVACLSCPERIEADAEPWWIAGATTSAPASGGRRVRRDPAACDHGQLGGSHDLDGDVERQLDDT